MTKYKCKNCGYLGASLIFQFNDYYYCVATNAEEPKYINHPPHWVKDKGYGDAEIGEPVACPKCHTWGSQNFESFEV